MNLGRLEVVQQEIARVNIDILQTSELKWTGLGEFDSDGHYIYTVGRIPWKKGSTPQSQQESEMQYLGAVSKMTE